VILNINPIRSSETYFVTIVLQYASNLVVVVLPLVPVTAIIGIRHDFPRIKHIDYRSCDISGQTFRRARCILKPGAAFTSRITPPLSLSCVKFSAIISHHKHQSNYSKFFQLKYVLRMQHITSTEVPPVLRLAVDFKYNTSPISGIVSV
jgi:hypothetical protein